MRAAGWRPAQADLTVVAETPKIGPHRAAIREKLAEAIGVGVDDVMIKGKTNERMGWVGRGEGVAHGGDRRWRGAENALIGADPRPDRLAGPALEGLGSDKRHRRGQAFDKRREGRLHRETPQAQPLMPGFSREFKWQGRGIGFRAPKIR